MAAIGTEEQLGGESTLRRGFKPIIPLSFQLSGSSSDLLSLARSDSTGSTTSMQQHGGVPELLMGLGYNGTTGRLAVEIVKGSQFRNLSLGKAPDTYVKLCLVSSMGQEIARSKTSTKRGQPNPLFKETFIFQVSYFVGRLGAEDLTMFIQTGRPFPTQWRHLNDFRLRQTKHETQRNGGMVFSWSKLEWPRRSPALQWHARRSEYQRPSRKMWLDCAVARFDGEFRI